MRSMCSYNASNRYVPRNGLHLPPPAEDPFELHTVLSRNQIANHRTRTFIVEKLDVVTNKVVLLFQVWAIQPPQRVVERFHLEGSR